MLDFSVKKHKTILTKIIDNDIKPFLIDNNFKKNGHMFYKNEVEILKLIEFEYFRFNSFAKFFFWINVSVFAGNYKCIKRYTKRYLFGLGMPFVVQRRIGQFWGEDNHMYEVLPDCDGRDLSEKMKSDLTKYVFPFFDQIKSCSDILKLFPDDNFRIATMFARMNKMKESKHYFLRCLEIDSIKYEIMGLPKDKYIGNVKAAAEKFGIIL